MNRRQMFAAVFGAIAAWITGKVPHPGYRIPASLKRWIFSPDVFKGAIPKFPQTERIAGVSKRTTWRLGWPAPRNYLWDGSRWVEIG